MNRFFLALFLLLSFPAAADVLVDIPYGPENLQKLDVYTSAHCPGAGCPVVLFIHGGGWRTGDKANENCVSAARAFSSRGVIFINANYRLTPAVHHPAHVEDVATAINWAWNNIAQYGGNKARLFVMGHSAGAHLAALVATDPRHLEQHNLKPTDLAGVIPVDGANYDLVERRGADRFLNRWINDAFGADAADASPLNHVSPEGHYPPFLIAAASVRHLAVKQSRELAGELQKAGNGADVLVVDYATKRSELAAHMQIMDDLSNPRHAMTERILAFIGAEK